VEISVISAISKATPDEKILLKLQEEIKPHKASGFASPVQGGGWGGSVGKGEAQTSLPRVQSCLSCTWVCPAAMGCCASGSQPLSPRGAALLGLCPHLMSRPWGPPSVWLKVPRSSAEGGREFCEVLGSKGSMHSRARCQIWGEKGDLTLNLFSSPFLFSFVLFPPSPFCSDVHTLCINSSLPTQHLQRETWLPADERSRLLFNASPGSWPQPAKIRRNSQHIPPSSWQPVCQTHGGEGSPSALAELEGLGWGLEVGSPAAALLQDFAQVPCCKIWAI